MNERLVDEAVAWHQSIGRDDADWDGFTVWLEADPRHRAAFDEIALIDRMVDERAGDLRQIGAIEPKPAAALPMPRSRRPWLYGSVAAAVAVAIGVPLAWQTPQDGIYATGRGEHRQIALGQGTSVALAPSTRLIAKGGDPTKLELVAGEAYFDVAHDPGRTLSIQAGDHRVTDIGTRFALNLTPKAVLVAVAEGQVSVMPNGGTATSVTAGHQLIAQRASGPARLRPVVVGNVGSWQRGRLIYVNTPLSIVAADIARNTGKTIIVDPAIESREFSGVLAIGDGSGLLPALAGLMAVSAEEKDSRVYLSAARTR